MHNDIEFMYRFFSEIEKNKVWNVIMKVNIFYK